MSVKKQFLTLCGFIVCLFSFGQEGFTWYNPLEEQAILGRVQSATLSAYNRLPDELEATTRKVVWSLGAHSTGLSIRFETDADSVEVRYQVKGALNMAHMPSTGVSGVDLYAYDTEAKRWGWAAGGYKFADTISYSYVGIGSNKARLYELYLPLYNSVQWMEIGVSKGKILEFKKDDRKPIVIYGTSIAHGLCAMRAGMSWTNILARQVQRPVINLAFAANGKLEQPILELMARQEAAVYVLDCMPNLVVGRDNNEEKLDSLIVNAVNYLRSKHAETPILLTEASAGYNLDFLNQSLMKQRELTTEVLRKAIIKLKAQGVKNLYTVSNEAIGLDVTTNVDFSHPNDSGMKKIADAYWEVLKGIEYGVEENAKIIINKETR